MQKKKYLVDESKISTHTKATTNKPKTKLSEATRTEPAHVVVGCLLGGESMLAGVRILRGAHIPNFGEIKDAFTAVGTAIRKKNHDQKPQEGK